MAWYMVPVMIFLPILIGILPGFVAGKLLRRCKNRGAMMAVIINEFIAVLAARRGFRLAGEMHPAVRD